MITKIYVLCEPDGKIRYVGRTYQKLCRRFGIHLHDATSGKRTYKCNWIRSLLSKGYLPKIQLIGEVEGNGWRDEIAWIKYFRDEGVDLVNQTDGGGGANGYKPSNEHRRKISEANKGRIVSQETRRKLSEIKNGSKILIEQCRKLGKTHKGKHLSEEHRCKLSEAGKRRIHSRETRHKMSVAHKKK